MLGGSTDKRQWYESVVGVVEDIPLNPWLWEVLDGEEAYFVSGGCGKNSMKYFKCVPYLIPIPSVSTLGVEIVKDILRMKRKGVRGAPREKRSPRIGSTDLLLIMAL